MITICAETTAEVNAIGVAFKTAGGAGRLFAGSAVQVRMVAAGSIDRWSAAYGGQRSPFAEFTAQPADPAGSRAGGSLGVTLIGAERHRQVAAEGWTAEHDAHHTAGELARVAAAYALYGGGAGQVVRPGYWPWPDWELKPGEALDSLVKAGALIAAEIDRLTANDPGDG